MRGLFAYISGHPYSLRNNQAFSNDLTDDLVVRGRFELSV